MAQRKRLKTCGSSDETNLFDNLPDDIVICILCKLSSSASSPSDLITLLLTSKRLSRLAFHPLVLSSAGPRTFSIKAKNWSDSAHRFLKQCAQAGNAEASYTLGMIRFYCLQNRGSGASLMAKAAIKSHARALYSLAVIQFNGSGASKNNKDLHAGVALCARAAVLGHVDALRELGHCLQDGYGVPQNVSEGCRLLIQANARELASSLRSILTWQQQRNLQHAQSITGPNGRPLHEVHPANRFLKEWFETGKGILGVGLGVCSYSGCGRPESRAHEFRRCSVCGNVNYCSRGCQAMDWKSRHKFQCVAFQYWHDEVVAENGFGGIADFQGQNSRFLGT